MDFVMQVCGAMLLVAAAMIALSIAVVMLYIIIVFVQTVIKDWAKSRKRKKSKRSKK